jgi:O-antigen/teichoic acid export membrane protein
MMMLNNVDVIMVKRYFDDFTAGYYAGIVTIGKILLFGAGTVGIVMFPQISESFAKKENFMGKFNKLLIIQIILVVVGVAVFSLFSKPLVTLMFGPKFISAVPYVPAFSIFMGLYVLTNYFVTFFLAIEKTRVFLFQIPAVILQFCLLNIFNDSIDKVIGINILITSGLLLFLIIYFLKYLQASKATLN